MATYQGSRLEGVHWTGFVTRNDLSYLGSDEEEEEEEEGEEIDYFQEVPADQGSGAPEVRGARDILYSDFFDPPESAPSKKDVTFEEEGDDQVESEGGVSSDDVGGAVSDGDEEGGFSDEGVGYSSDGGGTSEEEGEGLEGVALDNLKSGCGSKVGTGTGLEGDGQDLSKHERKQLMVSTVSELPLI